MRGLLTEGGVLSQKGGFDHRNVGKDNRRRVRK